MSEIPDRERQILTMHAGLIHRVVKACTSTEPVPDLEQILKQAEDNEWLQLVAAIRKILKGEREPNAFRNLDEEDSVIVRSILMGIQNPATLPDLNAEIDASLAAPGIAALVHSARTGNTDALQLIANMAQQMMQAGGDMARVAALIRPLVLGERDPNVLCEKLNDKSEKLVLDILKELKRLETH
jgi:hypothetical protein